MRIERLALRRYGHFDDHEIDFGRTAAECDLHIIYGDNEAGKSTVFNALLDALFGIPHKSSYTFQHKRAALRIDATITHDSRSQGFTRTGRGLQDLNGQAFEQLQLTPFLNGLDRPTYCAMFSMDEATLEQGGKDILASKGELGNLLFSAGSGLVGIHRRLESLMEEEASFYRPNANKDPLRKLKSSLSELDKDIAALDTRAKEFEQLLAERDLRSNALEECIERDNALRSKCNALENAQRLRQISRKLAHLEDQLEALETLPAVPVDWWESAKSNQFNTALSNATATRKQLTDNLDKLSKTLNAEAEPTNPHIATLMSELGIETVESEATLANTASREDRLRQLLQQRENLRTRKISAEKEVRQSADTPALLVRTTSDSPTDPTALQRRLQTIHDNENNRPTDALTEGCRQTEQSMRTALTRLQWNATIDELVQLPLPDQDTINSLRDVRAKVLAGLEASTDTQTSIGQQLQSLETIRRDLSESTINSLVSGETKGNEAGFNLNPATSLALCWQRWQQHRDALLSESDIEPTSKAFEQALRDHENWLQHYDTRLQGLARLRAMDSDLRKTKLEQEASQAKHMKLEAELEDIDSRISCIAKQLMLPADAGIRQLLEWLQQRESVLTLVTEYHEANVLLETRQAQRALTLQELDSLIIALKPDKPLLPASLEERIRDARALTETWASEQLAYTNQQQKNDEAASALNARTKSLELLTEEENTLQQDWLEAIQDTTLQNVAHKSVHPRLNNSLKLQHLLEAAAKQKEELQQQQFNAAADLEKHRLEAAGVFDEFERRKEALQVPTHSELQLKLDVCRERHTLQQQIDDLQEEIQSTSNEALSTSAIRGYSAIDAVELTDKITAAHAALEDSARERESCAATLQSAIDRVTAVGADNRVARLEEERETLRLSLQEQACSALCIRLGISAVQEGMRRYRQQHQSAMLSLASEYFTTLTRNRFRGLSPEQLKKQEVLYAHPAYGASKLASELSTGTRYQLYLALRMAAYRHYADNMSPPPFFADDIMETFDDQRTSATLEQFATMSKTGQVIYFTHHHHVVDLARSVTSDAVTIHELPAPKGLPQRDPGS
ncbi:MAG: AAA family ATPase [Granulosicoccus sp.]